MTPASQSKGIYGELVLLAVLVRCVSQVLSSSVISAPVELISTLSKEGCMNTVTGYIVCTAAFVAPLVLIARSAIRHQFAHQGDRQTLIVLVLFFNFHRIGPATRNPDPGYRVFGVSLALPIHLTHFALTAQIVSTSPGWSLVT